MYYYYGCRNYLHLSDATMSKTQSILLSVKLGFSYSEAAREFNVSRQYVRKIVLASYFKDWVWVRVKCPPHLSQRVTDICNAMIKRYLP